MIGALLLTMFAVADEPPAVGRPVDYSHVVGRFRIEATVEPKTVTVEDPVTLRVTIHGEDVTTPPTRANLRIFPEDFDFFREDVADEDRADPATGTWTFVWRLRPKSTDVREVPPLRLAYWSPAVRQYQATTTEAVPIEVKPREAVVDVPKVSSAPLDERFLDIGPASDPWAQGEATIWVVVLLAAAGLIWWGMSAGPREKPSPATEALAVLKHGDVAGLVRYLRLRFGLATDEPTPAEIEKALRRGGVEPKLRADWTEWWNRLDERRFSPRQGDEPRDPARAADLIRRTEAACTPRTSR